MRRPPANAKRDENEPDIVAMLEAWGMSVFLLDRPADAIVGWGDRTYLVEIKTAKGKLTPAQNKFLETWRGDHHILCSREDAMAFARKARGLTK